MDIVKIATFNINGIRSRLPALLEWLAREEPDVACLQELKAPDAAFPIKEIQAAGYGAVWHGQTSWNGVAILAKGMEPLESRRGLPGDEVDTHSRYLEAAAHGVIVGCLYLPNGNPQPGPKFDYKLAWFERLIKYAAGLYDSGHPVVLAGDYNVVPTDEDIYNPRSWLKDALLQPESRERYQRLLAQGWTDSLRAALSRQTHLYLLGLFPSALAEGFGIAHRSPVAQRRPGAAPPQCRRRSMGSRPTSCQRPRAGLDRTGSGREEEVNGTKRSLLRICGRDRMAGVSLRPPDRSFSVDK